MREVALGHDPSADRQAQRNSMTVAQLCNQYQAEMESGRLNGKKASTIKSDKSRIANHIVPKLGRYKVVSLTGENVEDFINKLSPGNANRVTGLLGAIFSYAVKKKLRADNPAHGIAKAPDVKRLRRLSDAEYAKLHVAIRDTQSGVVGDVLRMLAVSGWRNSEARCLKWAEVDLERKAAVLGDTKSGQSVRALSGAACEIIKRQERSSSPYVFAYQQGKPIGHLSLQWRKLGMPKDVTPHTLRHSFASLAAAMGLPDHTISGLLGHRNGNITSRYMHLADKALIEAADLVANERCG